MPFPAFQRAQDIGIRGSLTQSQASDHQQHQRALSSSSSQQQHQWPQNVPSVLLPGGALAGGGGPQRLSHHNLGELDAATSPRASMLSRIDGPGEGAPPLDPAMSMGQKKTKKAKISKKVNARLQLAAALVECDNDDILEHARIAEAALRLARQNPNYDANTPYPPPPPQPKLASQSAIFAPYRDEASVPSVEELRTTGPRTRARTGSNASRLSRLLNADGSPRPPSSVDFLGVKLPTEKRRQQQSAYGSGYPGASSAYSQSRPGSALSSGRPQSALSIASAERFGGSDAGMLGDDDDDDNDGEGEEGIHDGQGEPEEEALSEWGVDKFLSQEAKDKIAASGRRSRAGSRTGSRAGSIVGIETASSVAGPASDAGRHGRSMSGQNSVDMARTGSDGGTGPSISSKRKQSHDPDPALLARIKLYRERQENLPPSQWDGPGPMATQDDVDRHISSSAAQHEDGEEESGNMSQMPSVSTSLKGLDTITRESSGLEPAESLKQGSVPVQTRREELGEHHADEKRRTSSFGITGERWSDDEDDHDAQPHFPPSSHSTPYINYQDGYNEDGEVPLEGMAGVGSYSRSQSRPNSMMFGAPAQPPPREDGEDDYSATPIAFDPNLSLVPGQHLSRPSTPGGGQMMEGIPSPRPAHSPRDAGSRSPAILDRAPITNVDDPFGMFSLGPSPYPMMMNSPMARLMQLPSDPYEAARQQQQQQQQHHHQGTAYDGQQQYQQQGGLSTKQLQAAARQNFPDSYGITGMQVDNTGLPDEDAELVLYESMHFKKILSPEREKEEEEEHERKKKGEPSRRLTAALMDFALKQQQQQQQPPLDVIDDDVPGAEPLEQEPPSSKRKSRPLSAFFGGQQEPDLSSARWGRSKRRSLLSRKDEEVQALSAQYAAEPVGEIFSKLKHAAGQGGDDDVDDDFVSPPLKGPLKPRGIEACLPKMLVMPAPLQGTPDAPKSQLTDSAFVDKVGVGAANRPTSKLYVPDGFVLHDRNATPSIRQLQVQGASGPQPFFMAPDGRHKHDATVSDFLQSQAANRVLSVPAAAPVGIGRRAAMPTTALFRNQLVQHDDEKEGWGWEAGSAIGQDVANLATFAGLYSGDNPGFEDADEDGVRKKPKKKKVSRAEKKLAKKLAKEKHMRKVARRERRKKRQEAQDNGLSYEEVGVEEMSPDEDLDLSATDSDEFFTDDDLGGASSSDGEGSWNSEDERRWLDQQKPAGKLFGKSLLDVAEERKKTVQSKNRFYGQVELEEMNRLEAQSALVGDDKSMAAASTAARTFRENPLGYNDTRERMQAAFGTDMLWSREMAKRRDEEAKEAEIKRRAEEEFRRAEEERMERERQKKEKKEKKKNKKSKKGEQILEISAPIPGLSGPIRDDTEEPIQYEEEPLQSDPPRSQTPVDLPVLDVPIDHTTVMEEEEEEEQEASADEESGDEAQRRGKAFERARQSVLMEQAPANGYSSSEDDVPLARLRARATPNYAAGLGQPARRMADSDEEEELTLAQIIARKKARNQSLGTLDLDFMQAGQEDDGKAKGPTGADGTPQSKSSSAFRNSAASGGLRNEAKEVLQGEDSSDEDQPLGLKHANGAEILRNLAAQKAELARMKREAEAAADESSDDDRPLGAKHPQAAIIAEQAALIKRLQAEAEQARMQQSQTWNPHMSMMGFGGGGMMMSPPAPSPAAPPMSTMMGHTMPQAMSALNLQSAPPMMSPPMAYDPRMSMMGTPMMHHMPSMGSIAGTGASGGLLPDPRASSIAHWASQVPPDASGGGSGAGSGSNSARGALQ